MTAHPINPLAAYASGYAAVIVSAGPSLARAMPMLARARETCLLISTQTTLKPMLRAGVRPHLVCALDYHPISARFYEGLMARDVEGVELVVTPTVAPEVCDAWPGVLRMTGDAWLENLLGHEFATGRACLPQATNVAGMACHLARFMHADPLILVGQDLCCADGVYYGKGAQIHQVWGGELSEFRTLEMMEHERIFRSQPPPEFPSSFDLTGPMPVREGATVGVDQQGRRVYTDVQMAGYAVELGTQFGEDVKRGLRVLNTSDGLPLANTERMGLQEALAAHGCATPMRWPVRGRDMRARGMAGAMAEARVKEVACTGNLR